jgi:hypothetical protein
MTFKWLESYDDCIMDEGRKKKQKRQKKGK